jgi:inhibitor of KinA
MFEKVRQFGPNAILIEWQQSISNDIIDEIAFYTTELRDADIDGIVDIVPAYASLTIFFNPELQNRQKLMEILNNIKYHQVKSVNVNIWDIPVRYDSEQSADMLTLMKYTGLSRDSIVALHSETMYKVCFIGFLPGFLYLSGLPTELCIPRKDVPSTHIAKGSVAIGGCQTGIYPCDSPGGWHVIGNTDFDFIQYINMPYCPVQPGDTVKFVPLLSS